MATQRLLQRRDAQKLQSRWPVQALACTGLALAAGVGYWFRPFLPPPKVLNFTQITRDESRAVLRPLDGGQQVLSFWVGSRAGRFVGAL